MAGTIDYYLSLTSPWSYLGGPRLMEIARRHQVEIAVKPVEFGRILPVSGGLPLAKRAPQRQAYRLVDLKRWRDHLGATLNLHPAFFPVPDQLAACAVIAAGKTGGDAFRLSQAILTAVWAEERNIADTGTLTEIIESCGLHGVHVLATACDPETRFTLQTNTDEAIERGVFGMPSYVWRGEIFWGQDRLDFLERAVRASNAA
jgi:2-hydroxychromene-2-carboxylate isomerase